MSTLNCFGIIFDNPAAEYQAGEMIRGKVIVDLSNSLEVKGKLNVTWNTSTLIMLITTY